MGANRKRVRKAGEKAAQSARSERNKKRRIERNKPFKGEQQSLKLHLKKNRLRRLHESLKSKDLGIDTRRRYSDRYDELMKELDIKDVSEEIGLLTG